mgnify:CR=1 FL=1
MARRYKNVLKNFVKEETGHRRHLEVVPAVQLDELIWKLQLRNSDGKLLEMSSRLGDVVVPGDRLVVIAKVRESAKRARARDREGMCEERGTQVIRPRAESRAAGREGHQGDRGRAKERPWQR